MASSSNGSEYPIISYDPALHINSIVELWKSTLSKYGWDLPGERLLNLLHRPTAKHLVVQDPSQGNSIIAFAALYIHRAGFESEKISGYISVILVDPNFQHKGIGSRLHTSAKEHLKKLPNIDKIMLGSCFPRFFPGIPTNLPKEHQEWFSHRGWKMKEQLGWDFYQDLSRYQEPEGLLQKIEDSQGITYAPWRPEQLEQMINFQRANFSSYPGWVESYQILHENGRNHEAMCALDKDHNIIGATQILSNDLNNPARANLAWPSTIGPKVGNIGCVGVDANFRKGGVGQGMLAASLVKMKAKGLEGCFVDSAVLRSWYERAEFRPWREYLQAEPDMTRCPT